MLSRYASRTLHSSTSLTIILEDRKLLHTFYATTGQSRTHFFEYKNKCYKPRGNGCTSPSFSRTTPTTASLSLNTPVRPAAALERLESIEPHDKRHQLCQPRTPREKAKGCYHQAPEFHGRGCQSEKIRVVSGAAYKWVFARIHDPILARMA